MEKSHPIIYLAPMEGVVDSLMRELLCSINNIDMCITEFVRVVDRTVPTHTFHKICPELNSNGLTTGDTPVRVQLLGQSPSWLAENAAKAIELGSKGVDLNFGCPAKTVNKSKGGAVLLKEPETIYQILTSVKEAVGDNELSAKIRLGFDGPEQFDEIISAVLSTKVSMLTIHARTKKQGYKPPAHWQYIAQATSQPHDKIIVANGEIWNQEDASACMSVSGTQHLMLGRGILASPNLANEIKGTETRYQWNDVMKLLKLYAEKELVSDKSFYFSSRLKQWLRYMRLQYPEANQLFETIKRLEKKEDILPFLFHH